MNFQFFSAQHDYRDRIARIIKGKSYQWGLGFRAGCFSDSEDGWSRGDYHYAACDEYKQGYIQGFGYVAYLMTIRHLEHKT